ncbi:MAG: hypothetical protein EAY66_02770 [Sphingobacteriales bacterium]|jgi:hypothetical protein|nr:MAG: hypothetical protein EAY66_02770 [Sphingobacteriales bacterium]
MERIVIEVNAIAAKKWNVFSTEKKKAIEKSFENYINTSLATADDTFWQFVDRISKKASDNGMTEEKLNALLNEN